MYACVLSIVNPNPIEMSTALAVSHAKIETYMYT
jgi:hypothetical protein